MRKFAISAAILALLSASGATAQSVEKNENSPKAASAQAADPTPQEEPMKVGDLATWFSGIITAAVFLFTLHAWRDERHRASENERATKLEKEFSEASRVACWIEKSSTPLRRRTGADPSFLPDGTWALVIENSASYALFDWSVSAQTTNPSLTVAIDSHDKGPIGPSGGLLVLPLAGIPRDAVPTIAITVTFADESGTRWTRGPRGLTGGRVRSG